MKSKRTAADTADDDSLARDLDVAAVQSETSKVGSSSELELSYLDFDPPYPTSGESSSWKDPNLDKPLETPESKSFYDDLFLPDYSDSSDLDDSGSFIDNDWDEDTLDFHSSDDGLGSTLFSEDSDPDDGYRRRVEGGLDDQEFLFDADGTPELEVDDLELTQDLDLDSYSRKDTPEMIFLSANSAPELVYELDDGDLDIIECARGYFDDLSSQLSNRLGVAESGTEVFLGHEVIDERSEWSRERTPEVANGREMDWDVFNLSDEDDREEELLHVDSDSNSEHEELCLEEF